ncbi:MAG: phosphoribosylanthranilate isomerase [Gammaproteobacteria bacterium]|nr:phosphoribosylanthranilate isomerase [Gammaproteobacteria bacterium]MCF6230280.1 phosphoribosylanthranilate isomerase [Gammaproteobacteria bacterium]
MTTRVKICGITRIEDALTAAALGADAIGLVFYAPSPRAVGIQQAANIVAALPPFVSSVGLFVDADKAFVEDVIQRLSIDLLQFHGEESAEYCEQFDKPYMKAVRMREGLSLESWVLHYENAKALLLDSYQPGIPGGTGTTFDWGRIPDKMQKPIVLAGGLNAANVAGAIEQASPYAVDVSGGVEVSKGIKDAAKIAAFINEVKRV